MGSLFVDVNSKKRYFSKVSSVEGRYIKLMVA
jgi:hypothetical protein